MLNTRAYNTRQTDNLLDFLFCCHTAAAMDVKIVAFLFFSILIARSLCASIHERRAIEESKLSMSTESICQKSTPCGWAVYKKFSRVIDFFMQNRCECQKGQRCKRADDDISVSAFVYRCKDDEHPNFDSQS